MDGHTELIAALGRALLALLFLFQGASAARFRFGFHVERLRARKVPLPRLMLLCGLGMMFVGGTMLLLDVRADIGAALLLLFTAAATILYQNFWSIADPVRRRDKRSAFLYNLAIMGGLLLAMI